MEEVFSLSETCQTLCLLKENIFISAYPGKIVIGPIIDFNYKTKKCFIFFYNELIQLYLSIIQIITYFASEKHEDKGKILSKNIDFLYYWSGKVVVVNNCEQKVVKLGIQFEDDIIFEVSFTSSELNNLIFCLPQIIFSSLCLKQSERNCMEFITEQTTVTIVSISDKAKCEKFIEKNFEIDSIAKTNVTDMFLYYHEILLIIHKLKTLYNKEMKNSNIQKILEC